MSNTKNLDIKAHDLSVNITKMGVSIHKHSLLSEISFTAPNDMINFLSSSVENNMQYRKHAAQSTIIVIILLEHDTLQYGTSSSCNSLCFFSGSGILCMVLNFVWYVDTNKISTIFGIPIYVTQYLIFVTLYVKYENMLKYISISIQPLYLHMFKSRYSC